MKKNLHFYMELSNEDPVDFKVVGEVNDNVIQFRDINNVLNTITVHDNDSLTLERGMGPQTFAVGKNTIGKISQIENPLFDIRIYTHSLSFENNILKLRFDNYINETLTNEHNLTITITDIK